MTEPEDLKRIGVHPYYHRHERRPDLAASVLGYIVVPAIIGLALAAAWAWTR